MKNLIQWIRPAFEGHDGKASSKRLTTFSLISTIILMAFASLCGWVIDKDVLRSLEILAGWTISNSVYQAVKSNKDEANA